MKYDVYMMGTVAIEHESVDYDPALVGKVRRFIGGAVFFSSYSAISSGRRVGALVRTAPEDKWILDPFYIRDLTILPSRKTTSTNLVYHTRDKETRTSQFLATADPITPEDIPQGVEADIFQMAGSFLGEFDNRLFAHLASRGKVACDMQGFVRYARGTDLVYGDWAEKEQYLPYVTFLKADAAEAAVLTGTQDRKEAARMMHAWGAKEIMITHNTEVLVFDGKTFYTCPLRPRSLEGRSGRGDTTFASYITERTHVSVPQALLYASALVSLKMERPGPFKGTRQDVADFMAERYADPCVHSEDAI